MKCLPRKSLLIFLILQQTFSTALAQKILECGTPSRFPNRLKNVSPSVISRIQSSMTTLKIYIHLCRNTDGTAQSMTEAEAREEIRVADSVYRLGNINFCIVGVDVVSNSSLNNLISKNAIENSGTLVPNCFNVYLVSNMGNGIFGSAFAIPNNYIAVVPAGFGPRRTFIHEMGHDFGLFHTFHGGSFEPDIESCAELVNGSNAAACGDFVTDTPADPYYPYSSCNYVNGATCIYNGTCKDANNQLYAPDTHNYMSYWPNENAATCLRTRFSSRQFLRMQMTIADTLLLLNCVAPDVKNVSNGTVNSGKVIEVGKQILNAGNLSVGNYNLTGTVDAVLLSPAVVLKAGFLAQPSAAGKVLVQPSTICN